VEETQAKFEKDMQEQRVEEAERKKAKLEEDRWRGEEMRKKKEKEKETHPNFGKLRRKYFSSLSLFSRKFQKPSGHSSSPIRLDRCQKGAASNFLVCCVITYAQ